MKIKLFEENTSNYSATTNESSTDHEGNTQDNIKNEYVCPYSQNVVPFMYKELYSSWRENITELTVCQAVSPWFEMRCGHITGTTAKNIIRTLKYYFLDKYDVDETFSNLANILGKLLYEIFLKQIIYCHYTDIKCLQTGMKLDRPSIASLKKKNAVELKKGIKTLGYSLPIKSSKDEYIKILHKHYPSDNFILQKMIKCWCMTPIKKSSSKVQDSFRRGKLAENLCSKHIADFINVNTQGDLKVELIIETGLLKNTCNNVAAVSPDNIAVMKICNATSSVGNKILNLMKTNGYYDTVLDGNDVNAFICCVEYKNKSSVITLNKATYIVEIDLNKQLVVVIDLEKN